MTCEFCDGLGAVLVSDVIDKVITDIALNKEIYYEYGDDEALGLAYDGKILIDSTNREIVVLCDWCECRKLCGLLCSNLTFRCLL